MRRVTLLLAVSVMACSLGPSRDASPGPGDQPTAASVASPTFSAPTPTQTTAVPTTPPAPTPVAQTITGRARLSATGAGVAGVHVSAMPMPLGDGRMPGPVLTAVTDAGGAYSLTLQTWSLESLASSSSFQLMVQVTAPPGLLVLDISRSIGGPPGTAVGNLTGPTIVGDLSGPVDIALGPGHIVEGRVTSGVSSAPLAGVRVTALRPNSILIRGGAGDAFEIQASTLSDVAGGYRLTVPTGTFVVSVHGGAADQARFWSDDPAVFQASELSVERSISGIDVAVVAVTTVGGYVRSGPSFAEGVEGARVTAFAGGGTTCCRVVGRGTSGGAGTFLLQLPRGTYRLLIEPPTGSQYSAQWWRAAAGFASATDVTVASDPIELEVLLAR